MKRESITCRGVARNTQRKEENGQSVLSFRVQQTDAEGNIAGYTTVEFRGNGVRGALVDGDEVEVKGIVDETGILIPASIHNRTTNSTLSKAGSSKGLVLFLLPFLFSLVGLAFHPFSGFVVGWLIGAFASVLIFLILMAVTAFKK